MALPRADLPELKRFNFFVSRRFEEGRERFRLHMGFFATQAEAESWLGLVREVYPGAWTGEAPGKKLRARAVAAAEAQAAHASGPHSRAPQVEPPLPPPAASRAVAEALRPVPTLHPPSKPAAQGGAGSSAAGERQAKPLERPASRRAEKQPAVFADSNVREVLAALDEPQAATGETRKLPMPEAPLSDAQALQCLEGRDPTAVKPAAFAVQLKWSVQPIALETLPPLAIFSAYLLYCVEGSREGRKWYGLRLGFFNDPISAKQVAGYVRSEFASAAIVPVSAAERERVSGEPGTVPARPARKTPEPADQEFKLFDADAPVQRKGAVTPGARQAKAPVHELRPTPRAKRAAPANPVHARERRAPQTLEETLEILGANELTIDDGRDGTGGAHGAAQSRKTDRGTPFTRLLERLGERVRKS